MEGSLDTFGVSVRVYVPKVRTGVHALAGKSGLSLDSLPPVQVDSLITSIDVQLSIDSAFSRSVEFVSGGTEAFWAWRPKSRWR